MKMFNLKFFGIILILSACAEPQIAPDLPKHASPEFQIETLASGLSAPWSVASLSDGSYLVTERTGELKHILADGNIIEIAGLPPEIYVDQQGGL
ncbi:MAG: PQQ-dependent sugar dehydrogenase, partial [Robiginitomaculum sp.]|nr:PQQ-dependent sugar dehydrogenase [Robiginitomaculum sp.]